MTVASSEAGGLVVVAAAAAAFDGDAAGIKAALRGIDLILKGGLNVRIVLLPDSEDPDSYSKKMGSSEFQRYLKENSKDFIHTSHAAGINLAHIDRTRGK